MSSHGWTTVRQAIAESRDPAEAYWWEVKPGKLELNTSSLHILVSCCLDHPSFAGVGFDMRICKAIKPLNRGVLSE